MSNLGIIVEQVVNWYLEDTDEESGCLMAIEVATEVIFLN